MITSLSLSLSLFPLNLIQLKCKFSIEKKKKRNSSHVTRVSITFAFGTSIFVTTQAIITVQSAVVNGGALD